MNYERFLSTKMDEVKFYGVVDPWTGGELGLYKLPENMPAGQGSLIPRYATSDRVRLAQRVEEANYPIAHFRENLKAIADEAHLQAQGFFFGLSMMMSVGFPDAEHEYHYDGHLPLRELPDFLLPDFAEKRQYVQNSEEWARQLLCALDGK